MMYCSMNGLGKIVRYVIKIKIDPFLPLYTKSIPGSVNVKHKALKLWKKYMVKKLISRISLMV